MNPKRSFQRANDKIEQLRTKPEIAATVREFAAAREAMSETHGEVQAEPTHTADDGEGLNHRET